MDKLQHIANDMYKHFDLGARCHAMLLGTSVHSDNAKSGEVQRCVLYLNSKMKR